MNSYFLVLLFQNKLFITLHDAVKGIDNKVADFF
jgi:hypothetical protein